MTPLDLPHLARLHAEANATPKPCDCGSTHRTHFPGCASVLTGMLIGRARDNLRNALVTAAPELFRLAAIGQEAEQYTRAYWAMAVYPSAANAAAEQDAHDSMVRMVKP